ncbi:hypothetical protein MHPYR_470065 [uncultured Mycobacterium sp.]|uniref:Uncharacterized protein n=1 Tax=uncultured Mycobacterium sp. TaxID=171292 RepID=A0A1Y5PNK5_9MYCO|nr:hypothetical protein MHPYR_470065 [uncultured Mycobacterium sp.]
MAQRSEVANVASAKLTMLYFPVTLNFASVKSTNEPFPGVDTIRTLSLIMAVGPVVAIVLALWLIKPVRR